MSNFRIGKSFRCGIIILYIPFCKKNHTYKERRGWGSIGDVKGGRKIKIVEKKRTEKDILKAKKGLTIPVNIRCRPEYIPLSLPDDQDA